MVCMCVVLNVGDDMCCTYCVDKKSETDGSFLWELDGA